MYASHHVRHITVCCSDGLAYTSLVRQPLPSTYCYCAIAEGRGWRARPGLNVDLHGKHTCGSNRKEAIPPPPKEWGSTKLRAFTPGNSYLKEGSYRERDRHQDRHKLARQEEMVLCTFRYVRTAGAWLSSTIGQGECRIWTHGGVSVCVMECECV